MPPIDTRRHSLSKSPTSGALLDASLCCFCAPLPFTSSSPLCPLASSVQTYALMLPILVSASPILEPFSPTCRAYCCCPLVSQNTVTASGSFILKRAESKCPHEPPTLVHQPSSSHHAAPPPHHAPLSRRHVGLRFMRRLLGFACPALPEWLGDTSRLTRATSHVRSRTHSV